MGNSAKKAWEDEEWERFGRLIDAAFNGNSAEAAAYLGVSESSIRNWMGVRSGHCRDPNSVLASLGYGPAVICLANEEWQKLIAAAAEKFKKRASIIPTWLYTGGQLQVLESNAACKQFILITGDAVNDTQSPEVMEMVEQNVLDGISYLYVVPSDCPQRDELERLIHGLKLKWISAGSGGRVEILVTGHKSSELYWKSMDNVLLGLRDRLAGPASLASLTNRDVLYCFEQLYKPGDVFTDPEGKVQQAEQAWLNAPTRRFRLYLDILAEWSSGTQAAHT